jgi:small-conductance mechanosensitive channel
LLFIEQFAARKHIMIKRTQQTKPVSLLLNVLSTACVVVVIAYIYQIILGHWPPAGVWGGLAGGSIGSWFQKSSKRGTEKTLPPVNPRPEGQV